MSVVHLRRRPGGYHWVSPTGRQFVIDRNWDEYGMWECAEVKADGCEFIPGGGWTHLRGVRQELERIAEQEASGIVDADPRILTDEEEQELLANLHYEQESGS